MTLAPVYFTLLAVAINVKSGIIISSSFFIPKPTKARWSAFVPFEVEIAYFVPQYFANSCSNLSMYLPKEETHPDSTALVT